MLKFIDMVALHFLERPLISLIQLLPLGLIQNIDLWLIIILPCRFAAGGGLSVMFPMSVSSIFLL